MKKSISFIFFCGLLLSSASSATEQWPKERQHLLSGHYTGFVRDGWSEGKPCEFRSARLELRPGYRYWLVTRCNRGKGPEEVLTGTWFVDTTYTGFDCLILMQEPQIENRDDRLYGFTLENQPSTLHQDGGSCQAADDRDQDMILHRVR